MENSAIYRDMKAKMKYRNSPVEICVNCVNCVNTGAGRDFNLICNLNPVYTFITKPGATCKWFEESDKELGIN